MRLHPVTWLIVFAIALRLAADAIFAAGVLHAVIDAKASYGGPPGDISHLFVRHIREAGTALGYAGMAVMVEGSSRVWRALRDSRLAATGAQA